MGALRPGSDKPQEVSFWIFCLEMASLRSNELDSATLSIGDVVFLQDELKILPRERLVDLIHCQHQYNQVVTRALNRTVHLFKKHLQKVEKIATDYQAVEEDVESLDFPKIFHPDEAAFGSRRHVVRLGDQASATPGFNKFTQFKNKAPKPRVGRKTSANVLDLNFDTDSLDIVEFPSGSLSITLSQSQKVIDKEPETTLSETCPICLDDLTCKSPDVGNVKTEGASQSQQERVKLGCGHEIHLACFLPCLFSTLSNNPRLQKSCPVCRHPISQEVSKLTNNSLNFADRYPPFVSNLERDPPRPPDAPVRPREPTPAPALNPTPTPHPRASSSSSSSTSLRRGLSRPYISRLLRLSNPARTQNGTNLDPPHDEAARVAQNEASERRIPNLSTFSGRSHGRTSQQSHGERSLVWEESHHPSRGGGGGHHSHLHLHPHPTRPPNSGSLSPTWRY